MYWKTPPKNISTEIFARLPAQYRNTGQRSVWADSNRGGVAVDSFLEGPSFDRQGNLYVVDIPFGRVFRVSPQGEFELVVQYDGQPNGLKIHANGLIYIADYKNGIVRLDPATAKLEFLLEDVNSERFKGCNDLYFADDGTLYFTDQGQTGLHDPSGRVYRWCERTGRLDCLLDNVPSPNGLVLSDDQKTLFLAVTRANAVWKVPLRADGSVSKVGLYQQLSGGRSGPDGLAMDNLDQLFVCHAGMGTVWGFDALGRLNQVIDTQEGLGTTNLTFGGDENRTLFIVESDSGTILKAKLEHPGRTLFSHSDAI